MAPSRLEPALPSSAVQHVILAGGGIGGLAAALALAQRGLSVSVLEQAPAFGEVGAGIQLSPNATRVLISLGLERAVRDVAFAPVAAEVREHGRQDLLLRTELGPAAERRWGAPYLQVHRADLHGLLADAVARRPEVEVRLGAPVAGFDQAAGSVLARFDQGGEARTLAGDVLVGCDGIRSTVRATLWGPQPARFTGQVAWRGVVEAERLEPGLIPPVAMVWTGAARHLVHYPIRGGALVNVVGFLEQGEPPAESWTEPGDPAVFQAAFRGWPQPVQALVAAIGTPWRYAIHDRAPLARWSRGRATLLGDAAHPAPPFLAQGGGMALEDAAALARHLASGDSVERALQAYEAERRARTARVLAWSRRNARLFHLPPTAARAVFGAAALADRIAGHGAGARLDWLYGYRGGS